MSTAVARREVHLPALHAMPTSWADVERLGAVLAESGFFVDSKQAAQAITKVMAGLELGIPPIAAMTGIHIVKGKVTLGAHLIASQIRRSPRYDYRFAAPLTNEVCELEFLDLQGPEPVVIGTSRFTIEDAKKASLVRPDSPWQGHTRNMLFARAMSNGAKWFCPDVFAGPVYTPDELGATVDYATGEVVELPAGGPSPPAGGRVASSPATRPPAAFPGAPPAAGAQGPVGDAGGLTSPAGPPALSPGKAQFIALMEELGIQNNHTNRAHAIDTLTKRGITSGTLTDEARIAEAREALRKAFAIPLKASCVVRVPSGSVDGKGYDVTLRRTGADADARCDCEWARFHAHCKHAPEAWRELALSWTRAEPISPEQAWNGIDVAAVASDAELRYQETLAEVRGEPGDAA